MPRETLQYCHTHRVVESYPACDNGISTSRSAQLHPKDRPVVFENPQTGEVRYPARQDSPMMPGYAERGFERREFTSYQEHKKWCDAHDVINHAVEGIN
jgi:hypothetical protein